MDTTAIVLAGGQGSRMNFSDKAWIDFKGTPLLLHVIERVRPQVDEILISRNSTHPNYETLPFRKFADAQISNGHQGPLSGIAACHPAVTTMFTLVVPCDTPNLPEDLVSRLASRLTDKDVVVASDRSRDHYLVFLARTSVLGSISDHLGRGQRSVKSWLETVNYTRHEFADTDNPFLNINEPGQLNARSAPK